MAVLCMVANRHKVGCVLEALQYMICTPPSSWSSSAAAAPSGTARAPVEVLVRIANQG